MQQPSQFLSLAPSPLPPIHSSNKIILKSNLRTPSLSRIDLKPSTHRSPVSHYRQPRETTPNNSLENSKSSWKKLEKTRILEKMRNKSQIFQLTHRQNDGSLEKSRYSSAAVLEPSQHNISKFYLEYNNNHHPNRPRFLTKHELLDLLGLKQIGVAENDDRIREVVNSYPNCDFLDLSSLKITEKNNEEGGGGSLSQRFKKVLMKDSFNPNKLTETLKEFEHHSQNNSTKNPSKRQAVYEMAQFLDKISAEIVNPDTPVLDSSVFAMQNACRVCVQRLSTEISQECSERGILLARVWDLNLDLMNIYVRRLEKMAFELETRFSKNLIEIQSVFKSKIEDLDREVLKINDEKAKHLLTIKNLEQDLQFHKEKLGVSERLRKLMEADLEELMGNYEAILLENLRAKMKGFEEAGNKNEREIIRKGIEELVKSRQRKEKLGKGTSGPEKTMYKLDHIFKKMTSGELGPNELKETTSHFMRQMTNLSFNVLDMPKRYEDYLNQDFLNKEDVQGAVSYFVKEASTDTSDLIVAVDKTIDGRIFVAERTREAEVMTVLIDEIGDTEGESPEMLASEFMFRGRKAGNSIGRKLDTPNINNLDSKGYLGSPMRGSRNFGNSPNRGAALHFLGNNNLNSPDNPHSAIRKRIFNFNQEVLQSLDRTVDMNSLSVSKLIDFFNSEMQIFYSLLMNISEEITQMSPSHEQNNLNIDWFATQESILNNKGLCDQFLGLLLDRDRKRMAELLAQKIEIIQKNLDLEDAARNFQRLDLKYKRITKKFDEFFEFILEEEAEKLETGDSVSLSEKKQSERSSLKQTTRKLRKKSPADDSQIDRVELLKTFRSKNSTVLAPIQKQLINHSRKMSYTEENIKSSMDQLEPIKEMKPNQSEKRMKMLNDALRGFSNARVQLKVQSPNAQHCTLFMRKSRVLLDRNKEAMSSKNQGGLTIPAIVKTVSPLLIELLKRVVKASGTRVQLNPFSYIFYEYMFNRHALSRESTEARIMKTLQSAIFFKENARMRNYLRLTTMTKHEFQSDGSDILFYLECLRDLDDSFIGPKSPSLDSPSTTIPGITLLLNQKDSAKIGLSKAIDKLCSFFKTTLDASKYPLKLEDFMNKLKAAKEPDPLISRKYVVDVDLVVEQLFWIREELQRELLKVFQVVDLENRQALDVNEFGLLVRNLGFLGTRVEVIDKRNSKIDASTTVHYELGGVGEVNEIFATESDLVDEEGKDLMGFKRFLSLCEEKGWSLKKGVEKMTKKGRDEIKNIEILKKEWEVRKNLIKLRFIKAGAYNRFYSRTIKRFEELISNHDDEKAWALYRLVDEESCEIVLRWEVEGIMGKELIQFRENYKRMRGGRD